MYVYVRVRVCVKRPTESKNNVAGLDAPVCQEVPPVCNLRESE